MTTEAPASPPETRVNACKSCGGPVDRSRPWQEFCGDLCRYAFHNERRRKQSPSAARTVTAGWEQRKESERRKPTTIRSGTKLHTIASALVRGRRLDCFMAVREFHDYTLRSTISELANRFGIDIERTPKIVPGYAGSTVHCVEYGVTGNGAKRLALLLGLGQTDACAETL